MRKPIILCIIIVHAVGLYAQTNIKSGLLLGGGRISSTYDDRAKITFKDKVEVNPKFDVGIGYRFRLQPENKKFFVDLDLLAGLRKIESSFYRNYYGEAEDVVAGIRGDISSQINHSYIQFSFNPTFNYNFFDGWYAGLGIEPMFYTASPRKITNKQDDGFDYHKKFSGFDVPLTAKLGYDFKFMDVAIGYKYGLLDVLTPVYFNSGKVRAWQLQVFIPF
jgi:hypothetical protein